jgi:hypothetical protein
MAKHLSRKATGGQHNKKETAALPLQGADNSSKQQGPKQPPTNKNLQDLARRGFSGLWKPVAKGALMKTTLLAFLLGGFPIAVCCWRITANANSWSTAQAFSLPPPMGAQASSYSDRFKHQQPPRVKKNGKDTEAPTAE